MVIEERGSLSKTNCGFAALSNNISRLIKQQWKMPLTCHNYAMWFNKKVNDADEIKLQIASMPQTRRAHNKQFPIFVSPLTNAK